MNRGQPPVRLKRWIFIWTPLLWLLLELVLFPKNRPVSSGFSHVMGGFIDSHIASYPAWTLWLLALLFIAVAVFSRRAQKQGSRQPLILTAIAVVAVVWALAQMGFGHVALAGRQSSYSWLFQTVVLALVAVVLLVSVVSCTSTLDNAR